MPLPPGCSSVTLVEVLEIDPETDKATMCYLEYVVQGTAYRDVFNIGQGFLADLWQRVARRVYEQAKFAQAATIIANKIS